MTLPHLPGELAKIRRKNRARFQIVGIENHAKTRVTTGFHSSEVKNGRTNVTVYMNYSGMRVRDEADIKTIIDAVDILLGTLGKRVHSVVNYERFSCDDEVFAQYIDAVKYVEETYYIDVKRYTSGAFLRHKLGSELAKREISSEVLGC